MFLLGVVIAFGILLAASQSSPGVIKAVLNSSYTSNTSLYLLIAMLVVFALEVITFLVSKAVQSTTGKKKIKPSTAYSVFLTVAALGTAYWDVSRGGLIVRSMGHYWYFLMEFVFYWFSAYSFANLTYNIIYIFSPVTGKTTADSDGIRYPTDYFRQKYTQEDLSKMDPFQFEKLVADVLDKQGYKSKLTQKSRDGGVDIILDNNGKSVFVSVKRYNNTVGVDKVREIHSVANYNNAAFGALITNATVSLDALTWANRCTPRVIVVEGDRLLRALNESGDSAALLA